MEKKNDNFQVLIITGLSGAGKTQVVNYLEDWGYFCVDNLPPTLLTKFTELSMQSEGKINKVALVMDVRGGEFFHDLFNALIELKQNNIKYEILFLEASNEVLIRRFKETRRRHPLAPEGRLLEAIQNERSMLEELRGKANVIIDTSNISPRDLKEKLLTLYSSDENSGGFSISLISFGYKAGIPLDTDLIMDVRFIPNPYYDPVMKNMTGQDTEVIDYVLESSITKSFIRRFLNLLKFLIPNYITEGKTNLSIAIGCTGGQHRSVAITDYIGKQLNRLGYNVTVKHRDVSKYTMED
ncbi:RNase adapter protein RapZ [Candidatus Syntrophocurvum alkaliphilum]|uniref:RNase adapter protein RapZ n=1 Tax=Candidatus Syntrophocurvum alkaliphilum TaxID=2293317 RepID=A0A6I6DCN5_9FIRM|nr:RNase adapter RapZ [Candidatus Syntrophocurvum alkaliphilum]QGU00362.1 RNase adapter protein RapZ [Candidatus Syntrophocurvum alkaliphilum]